MGDNEVEDHSNCDDTYVDNVKSATSLCTQSMIYISTHECKLCQ